ncbi:Uncharacterised protein [Bordetella pertussis]|nr:Uncharacterised protein [Bordetella pertussis]
MPSRYILVAGSHATMPRPVRWRSSRKTVGCGRPAILDSSLSENPRFIGADKAFRISIDLRRDCAVSRGADAGMFFMFT